MLARPPKNGTLAAIDRAVASLPPFPSFGPLPDQITGGYRDKPCSSPKARFGVGGVGNACQCGFEMGEHSTDSRVTAQASGDTVEAAWAAWDERGK